MAKVKVFQVLSLREIRDIIAVSSRKSTTETPAMRLRIIH